MSAPARWEAAALALAFAVAALVALAIAWSGPATYEAIARDHGFDRSTFRVPAGAPDASEVRHDLADWVDLHRATLRYVLGMDPAPPPAPGGQAFYGEAEARHLADVRAVFALATAAMWAAIVALVIVLTRAARRGAGDVLRLARSGGALAGVGVGALVLVAAIAFWPLFLAFHYVFFPQGNFLFDPATSNLVRLYPLEYWQGVTLRLLLSFVALAASVSVSAHAALRRRARIAAARAD
ncbi:MAG TPA: DUF1461 domain-containing protein [Candidatus Limnocylindrales bacterium]|nr:DUF1461 domain-containing protein [Candidatus Limnocylindrales bacterium]